MKNKKVYTLVSGAVIAALYAALTLSLIHISEPTD